MIKNTQRNNRELAPRTRVDLEVHPEVAGVTESLAAVFTLVRLHAHVPHEVHIELSGRDESPGAHAAFEFLLPHMPLTFPVCSGGTTVRVSVTAAPAAAVTVGLRRRVGVAGPGRRGRAGGPVGELLLLSVLRWLLLLLLLWLMLLQGVVLLRRAVAVWRLVMAVVTVMAVQMGLELGKGGALFAALAHLTLR